ncbi:hypothetical protein H9P43_008521 [Blastocladiella emersonii ATCC 22665]|nr:hypothetical protein H9P43_008521 [Blastocladiella emersonii ATCC 22665]
MSPPPPPPATATATAAADKHRRRASTLARSVAAKGPLPDLPPATQRAPSAAMTLPRIDTSSKRVRAAARTKSSPLPPSPSSPAVASPASSHATTTSGLRATPASLLDRDRDRDRDSARDGLSKLAYAVHELVCGEQDYATALAALATTLPAFLAPPGPDGDDDATVDPSDAVLLVRSLPDLARRHRRLARALAASSALPASPSDDALESNPVGAAYAAALAFLDVMEDPGAVASYAEYCAPHAAALAAWRKRVVVPESAVTQRFLTPLLAAATAPANLPPPCHLDGCGRDRAAGPLDRSSPESVLALPVQRLTRYPLLLNSIARHLAAALHGAHSAAGDAVDRALRLARHLASTVDTLRDAYEQRTRAQAFWASATLPSVPSATDDSLPRSRSSRKSLVQGTAQVPPAAAAAAYAWAATVPAVNASLTRHLLDLDDPAMASTVLDPSAYLSGATDAAVPEHRDQLARLAASMRATSDASVQAWWRHVLAMASASRATADGLDDGIVFSVPRSAGPEPDALPDGLSLRLASGLAVEGLATVVLRPSSAGLATPPASPLDMPALESRRGSGSGGIGRRASLYLFGSSPSSSPTAASPSSPRQLAADVPTPTRRSRRSLSQPPRPTSSSSSFKVSTSSASLNSLNGCTCDRDDAPEVPPLPLPSSILHFPDLALAAPAELLPFSIPYSESPSGTIDSRTSADSGIARSVSLSTGTLATSTTVPMGPVHVGMFLFSDGCLVAATPSPPPSRGSAGDQDPKPVVRFAWDLRQDNWQVHELITHPDASASGSPFGDDLAGDPTSAGVTRWGLRLASPTAHIDLYARTQRTRNAWMAALYETIHHGQPPTVFPAGVASAATGSRGTATPHTTPRTSPAVSPASHPKPVAGSALHSPKMAPLELPSSTWDAAHASPPSGPAWPTPTFLEIPLVMPTLPDALVPASSTSLHRVPSSGDEHDDDHPHAAALQVPWTLPRAAKLAAEGASATSATSKRSSRVWHGITKRATQVVSTSSRRTAAAAASARTAAAATAAAMAAVDVAFADLFSYIPRDTATITAAASAKPVAATAGVSALDEWELAGGLEPTENGLTYTTANISSASAAPAAEDAPAVVSVGRRIHDDVCDAAGKVCAGGGSGGSGSGSDNESMIASVGPSDVGARNEAPVLPSSRILDPPVRGDSFRPLSGVYSDFGPIPVTKRSSSLYYATPASRSDVSEGAATAPPVPSTGNAPHGTLLQRTPSGRIRTGRVPHRTVSRRPLGATRPSPSPLRIPPRRESLRPANSVTLTRSANEPPSPPPPAFFPPPASPSANRTLRRTSIASLAGVSPPPSPSLIPISSGFATAPVPEAILSSWTSVDSDDHEDDEDATSALAPLGMAAARSSSFLPSSTVSASKRAAATIEAASPAASTTPALAHRASWFSPADFGGTAGSASPLLPPKPAPGSMAKAAKTRQRPASVMGPTPTAPVAQASSSSSSSVRGWMWKNMVTRWKTTAATSGAAGASPAGGTRAAVAAGAAAPNQ